VDQSISLWLWLCAYAKAYAPGLTLFNTTIDNNILQHVSSSVFDPHLIYRILIDHINFSEDSSYYLKAYIVGPWLKFEIGNVDSVAIEIDQSEHSNLSADYSDWSIPTATKPANRNVITA